jgi:thiosulfate/3-mercaptopyruvate sulfurtransferase
MYETLISVDELSALMNAAKVDYVIVDCRFALANVNWGFEEYTIGHIPGAVYAHLNEDLSGPVIPGKSGRHPLPDPDKFVEWVQKMGISNQTQVFVYDQAGGGYAARLWWLMQWIGHRAVAVVDGGWAVWQRAGLPVDDHIPKPEAVKFVPSFRHDLIVNADEVSQWSCDSRYAVVDSREPRRYEGLEEPIDPVAGHIPGAINKPFAENTNPDGTWKTPDELRARFEPLLAERESEKIAFYCGSGVTASQNILAFKHAGLGDAKLYPGSWSEWITDERRGVERVRLR